MQKNSCAFWKSWNSKFSRRQKNAQIVDGLSDEPRIAHNFADFFAKNCNSHSTDNDLFSNMFAERMTMYEGDCLYNVNDVSVECIDNIINGLKLDKAPGIDSLTASHLKYCHPAVIVTLTKLFKLMIVYQFVPNEFREGIIVPIPKDKKNYAT